MTDPQTAPIDSSPPSETRQLVQALSMISQSLDHIATGIARTHTLLRQSLLSQCVYLGQGTAMTYDDHLSKIFVDTRVRDIGPHLLFGGIWESQWRDIFVKLIRPNDVVFDVGANIGVYTLAAARCVGSDGQVHAFEPNPRLAELLNRSIAVNGFLYQAMVHELALSNQDGEAVLRLNSGESGRATLREKALPANFLETLTCQTRRADGMFDADFRVDVIKIDVEGFEGCVLQGMRDLLVRSENVRIMIEWYTPMLNAAPVNAAQTVDLLRELGFSAWECGPELSLASTTWEALLVPGQDLRNIVVARSDPFG